MDPMNMAVYASAMVNQMKGSTREGRRPAERWEHSPSRGLGDVLRVATVLGAAAAFAGILALGTR